MTRPRETSPCVALFGGASETVALVRALGEAGFRVLLCTVTEEDFATADLGWVEHHIGALNAEGMVDLLQEHAASHVVIATHPYAIEAAANARAAAEQLELPHLRYVRPATELANGTPDQRLIEAPNHEEAARLACKLGGPVLLTTGSRNLDPYVRAARDAGCELAARVLDRPESIKACLQAGIPRTRIIAGRGPFSVPDNLAHLRRFGASTLVTKDGGLAGGMPEKLAAAREAGCTVVMVGRPDIDETAVCRDIDQIAARCQAELRGSEAP